MDVASLTGCLAAIRDVITALDPYDGVPFPRKPLLSRKAVVKADLVAAGPGGTALAALERVGQELVGLFRGLADGLAARCTTRTARRKRPEAEPTSVLTPPQVAKRLGVSPDKILAWIRKGELAATNVAAGHGGRPRYRISEEDLAVFQKRRQPSKPTTTPPRRRTKDPHVIEFFK
jgi:excisionase family DNA binding protein